MNVTSYRQAVYNGLGVRVLRKQDGTGIFVFPDAVPNADPGAFLQERIDSNLLYRRDNRAHDPDSGCWPRHRSPEARDARHTLGDGGFDLGTTFVLPPDAI